MSNKFIQPATPRPAPRASATPQQGQQKATPRRMVEELSTQSFEFPQSRGSRPGAAPVGDSAPEARPQTTPSTLEQVRPTVKSYAEIDPEFYSIELPSQFRFYGFSSISCRTLKAAHQAKFSRANKEQKLRYSVEAISATLEPGLSAFDLSPSDFYFLMYWQKVNSFKRNPMIITAYCDNEAHNHSVYIGDEVPDEENPGQMKTVKKSEETLRTEVVLSNTTLESKYLEQCDLSGLEDIVQRYDLHIETMRDVVEITEYIVDNDVSEEELFLFQYVPFIRRQLDADGNHVNDVKRRLTIAAEIDGEDLILFDDYIKRVTDYGVSEYANIKCKECGASQRVKISFDALTFLPGR